MRCGIKRVLTVLLSLAVICLQTLISREYGRRKRGRISIRTPR